MLVYLYVFLQARVCDRVPPAVQDDQPAAVQDCGKALHDTSAGAEVLGAVGRSVRPRPQAEVPHRPGKST